MAIKLHVGELGNPHYVPPYFIYRLAEGIRAAGGKPFLTDSNTYYHGMRANACDHMENAFLNGYGGLPFIAADGLRSENFRSVKTKGILDEIEVSGAIAEADAMIVVSHDKGHVLTAGGAIKNLGMAARPGGNGDTGRSGSLSTRTGVTAAVSASRPARWAAGDRRWQGPERFAECMRCPMCSSLCPNKAIELHDLENVSKALASASFGVLSTFKKNKVSFVSFAKDISEFCDCLPGPGKIVMDDIGIFAADSPVSVDAAFLNMADYMFFNKAYGVDCFEQLKEAKKLGIKGDLKPGIKKL